MNFLLFCPPSFCQLVYRRSPCAIDLFKEKAGLLDKRAHGNFGEQGPLQLHCAESTSTA
eukprot:m.443956 g.443956  ORF g.443956 m.443956 type:complete len:59 (-) comp19031_c0_seq1:1132-1308(-)